MLPLPYSCSRPAAASKYRAMTMLNLAALNPGSPSFRLLARNRPKGAKAIAPAKIPAVSADIPELRICTRRAGHYGAAEASREFSPAKSGTTEHGILTVGKECI